MQFKSGEAESTPSEYLGRAAAEVLLCDRAECTPQEHAGFVNDAVKRATYEIKQNR
jgi:hypothetical protein